MTTTIPLQLVDLRVGVPDGDHERTLLAGVDLSVAAGEIIVLTGASGSGKSTLLAITGLLRRTDAGDVKIVGRSTKDLSERQRSAIRGAQIGIIYQSANLLPSLTAREQLELVDHIAGRKGPASRRRADELLDTVGMSHRADALPQHLSGGERQRVGIARALMAEPSVLLADEPTASLDPELTQDIVDLIARETHRRGVATVLVTHDDVPLQVADRHLHLAAGQLNDVNPSRV